MSTLIHSLFRSLEACIHERLAMIEDVISGLKVEKGGAAAASDEKTTELSKKVVELEERLRLLEKTGVSPATPSSSGVWIDALKDLEIVLPKTPVVAPVARALPEVEPAVVTAAVPVAKIAINMVKEEVELVEEEEVEEEVEEEGVEEITYKGKTYYKDSENKIYSATEDELGEPIGVWDVSRQRVLFKRPL